MTSGLLTSKVISGPDECKDRVKQKTQLMGETLSKYSDRKNVDPSLQGRRLVLVDKEGPRKQKNANWRTDARCQPFTNLASHLCNNKKDDL